MATTKKRINITANADIEEILTRSARRDKLPVTTKAAHLLRLALELEEDLALSALANERLVMKSRYLSHEQAWS